LNILADICQTNVVVQLQQMALNVWSEGKSFKTHPVGFPGGGCLRDESLEPTAQGKNVTAMDDH